MIIDMHTENCDPEFGCDENCMTPLPPEEAVQRVLALADELEREWRGQFRAEASDVLDVAARIRAAVAGIR